MTQTRPARGGANGSHSRLPLIVALAGGALLLAMLVVLVMVLGELKSTRDNVAGTDAKLARVIEASTPVADDVPPLLDQASTLVSETLPGVRDATALLEPLADNGIDASVVLDQLPALGRSASGLVADASVAAQAASAFLDAALQQDLVGTVSDANSTLHSLLEVQIATLRTQRANYRTQRASLKTQIRTTHKFKRSLDIQRSTLEHVRSIDNKTGGEFPPP